MLVAPNQKMVSLERSDPDKCRIQKIACRLQMVRPFKRVRRNLRPLCGWRTFANGIERAHEIADRAPEMRVVKLDPKTTVGDDRCVLGAGAPTEPLHWQLAQ